MSIRKKALIINLIILIILAVVFVATISLLINGFVKVEDAEAGKNVKRATDALNNNVAALDTKLVDWSAWDDTYQFITDKNEAYLKSNLQSHSLGSLKINLMIFINQKGEIVKIKSIDRKTEQDMPLPQDLIKIIQSNKNLFHFEDVAGTEKGLLTLPEGTLLLASRPIVKSSGEGPAKGTLIFARYLDQDLSKQLSGLVDLPVVYEQLTNLPPDFKSAQSSLSSLGQPSVTQKVGNKLIFGYGLINDILNKPALMVRVEANRVIYQQGIQSITAFALIFGVFFAIFSFIRQMILETTIISRIFKLREGVLFIGSNKSSNQRVEVSGKDEISDLANQINAMLSSIDQTELIKEERARLESSINSTNLGFLMLNTKYQIVNINTAAKRLLYHSKIDVPVTNAITKETLDIEFSFEDVLEILRPSINLKTHIDASLKDNKPVDIKDVSFGNKFIHLYIAPIILLENQAIKVIGIVIVMEDVTEEKILQRSKDEFFSIASHELRTPLTAIRGNTALIKQYYPQLFKDQSFSEMVSDIHESSIRLIDIVNDFLDLSRLEQGKILFKKEVIDLPPIIEDTVKEYQNAAEAKNLQIIFSKPSTPLPKILADTDRVKQILVNLIGNSLKFTSSGKIDIFITSKSNYLKISVRDTGRGIPPENQNLLFRKFQQAGNSLLTRDSTKGTGLGLYISRLMVEAMGGSIQLESSKEGEGTTFSFSLPVATDNLQSTRIKSI